MSEIRYIRDILRTSRIKELKNSEAYATALKIGMSYYRQVENGQVIPSLRLLKRIIEMLHLEDQTDLLVEMLKKEKMERYKQVLDNTFIL